MQDQSDSQTGVVSPPTARDQLRDELVGPPRPSKRAQFSAVAFGLLLVATLAIPVFWDVEPMPGLALIAAGMMMLLGFAELMDANNRRFIIAVRSGGFAIGLLGLAIQLV